MATAFPGIRNQPLIEIIEDHNQAPLCRHCGQEPAGVRARMTRNAPGLGHGCFRSHSRKVPGISRRKGLWMD